MNAKLKTVLKLLGKERQQLKAFQEKSGVEGAVLENESFGSHPYMACG